MQRGSFNEAAIIIIWLPCAPRALARASPSFPLHNGTETGTDRLRSRDVRTAAAVDSSHQGSDL